MNEGEKVGYGRPPVATRFKPGMSGNPSGKRKAKPSLSQRLDRIQVLARCGLAGHFLGRAQHVFGQRTQDRVLALEIVIDGGAAQAQGLGNILDAGAARAALDEKRGRGVEYGGAQRFALQRSLGACVVHVAMFLE